MTTPDLPARALWHTALRAELDRQGVLHARERELLLDAADALLFDEPEAVERRAEALELLSVLVANERRTDSEAARLREALEGCGAVVAAEAELDAVPLAA
jgi:hypothetical protein